jgi:hypothetical protein
MRLVHCHCVVQSLTIIVTPHSGRAPPAWIDMLGFSPIPASPLAVSVDGHTVDPVSLPLENAREGPKGLLQLRPKRVI